MFSMSQTWLSLLGWWEEWPGDSLTQDLRNISLLEDVIQLKQMKQPLISVNLWIMMIKILYQALTLSCSTSGAGSRIQSTSMPLISIFWVSFRYVHSPNKKGLRQNSRVHPVSHRWWGPLLNWVIWPNIFVQISLNIFIKIFQPNKSQLSAFSVTFGRTFEFSHDLLNPMHFWGLL